MLLVGDASSTSSDIGVGPDDTFCVVHPFPLLTFVRFL